MLDRQKSKKGVVSLEKDVSSCKNMSFKNRNVYPWVVVGLLWFVALLNYMDRQMLSTLREVMMIDIAELESARSFGQLLAVFLWVYGLMSPVSGMVADRMSKKWLIIGSLFVWSGVTLLMGFCTSFHSLYLLRAVMGVSEAMYIPAGLALIADYHEGKTRSLAVGIHMTGLYLGQALGGFGAAIAGEYSWQVTFFAFGIVGMLYSVLLVAFLKDKPTVQAISAEGLVGSRPSVFKGVGLLLSNFSFWIILLYFATPSLPGWATKNWLPTLFASTLNISMEQAGPLSTITIAASSFVGVIFGGLLSDRWIVRNVRGRVYTGAIGLFLTIPALLLLGFGEQVATVVGGALCFGVGFGMFDANNMPILCQFVPSHYRATAYGLMNTVGVFAGAIITNVLGHSTDIGNLGRDFGLLAVGIVVVLALQLIFLRPTTLNKEEMI